MMPAAAFENLTWHRMQYHQFSQPPSANLVPHAFLPTSRKALIMSLMLAAVSQPRTDLIQQGILPAQTLFNKAYCRARPHVQHCRSLDLEANTQSRALMLTDLLDISFALPD